MCIANALFVPGARPDVEAAYATNGPFTLYAFAFDKEAHATT